MSDFHPLLYIQHSPESLGFAPPFCEDADDFQDSAAFNASLAKLKKNHALQWIYDTSTQLVIVSPLKELADTVNALLASTRGEPTTTRYLESLVREWYFVITCAAFDHPYRNDLLYGLPDALRGVRPRVPTWTKYLKSKIAAIGEGEAVTFRPLPAKSLEDLGASAEVSKDLRDVLHKLGYGEALKLKPGPEPG